MARMHSKKESPPKVIERKNRPGNHEHHVPILQLPEELPVFTVPLFEKKLKYEVAREDDVLDTDERMVDQGDTEIGSMKRERNRKRKLKKRRHKERTRQLDSDGSIKVTEKDDTSTAKASPFVFDGVIEVESNTNSQCVDSSLNTFGSHTVLSNDS